MNTPTTKRFRGAIGFVDTDSEEDIEIDISATLTSEGVSIRHQAFSTKRLKLSHSNGRAERAPHNTTVIPMESPIAADSSHAKGTGTSAEEKKKDQVCFNVHIGRLSDILEIASIGFDFDICKSF